MPLCWAIVKLPFEVKLVKVPKDVTLGCAAVCNVPVKLVAVKSLISVILLLESDNTNLLNPDAIFTNGLLIVWSYNISPP